MYTYYTDQWKLPILNVHELRWTVKPQMNSDELSSSFKHVQIRSSSFKFFQECSSLFKFFQTFSSSESWINLNQFEFSLNQLESFFIQVFSESRKNVLNSTQTLKIIFTIKKFYICIFFKQEKFNYVIFKGFCSYIIKQFKDEFYLYEKVYWYDVSVVSSTIIK